MAAGSAEMVDALGDSTNDEIIDWVSASGGTVDFLHAVFLGIQESFMAERAAGAQVTTQWIIGAPEGPIEYEMRIRDGRCHVAPGVVEDADVTLELDLPDFLRLVLGSVSGEAAYTRGILRIDGDKALAKTINDWFRPPH